MSVCYLKCAHDFKEKLHPPKLYISFVIFSALCFTCTCEITCILQSTHVCNVIWLQRTKNKETPPKIHVCITKLRVAANKSQVSKKKKKFSCKFSITYPTPIGWSSWTKRSLRALDWVTFLLDQVGFEPTTCLLVRMQCLYATEIARFSSMSQFQ